MTSIADPKNGNSLEITDERRALVSSVSESLDRSQNRKGLVWSYDFDDVNPAGANDKFIYFKNTSSDKDYIFVDFHLWSSTTAGVCKIKTVTGMPTFVTGADITPVVRNTRFSTSPSLTAKEDTDVTNLADVGVVHQLNLNPVDEQKLLRSTSGVILGPGGQLVLEWEPATGEISGTITVAELN